MSVKYVVKVPRGTSVEPVAVCVKAFCSLFGITKNRVETVRKALSSTVELELEYIKISI